MTFNLRERESVAAIRSSVDGIGQCHLHFGAGRDHSNFSEFGKRHVTPLKMCAVSPLLKNFQLSHNCRPPEAHMRALVAVLERIHHTDAHEVQIAFLIEQIRH